MLPFLQRTDLSLPTCITGFRFLKCPRTHMGIFITVSSQVLMQCQLRSHKITHIPVPETLCSKDCERPRKIQLSIIVLVENLINLI